MLDEEKCKELELVAYGCNRRVHNDLEKFLDDQRIQSFTFYEFFCVEPIERQNVLGLSKLELLCPFIKRFAIGSPLLPKKSELQVDNENILTEREERSKKNIVEFYDPLNITIEKDKGDSWNVLTKWNSNDGKLSIQIVHKNLNEFKEYIKAADKSKKKEFAIVNVCWWEYLKSVAGNTVAFIYIPIASKSYFYGELLLIIEDKKINEMTALQGIIDEVKKEEIKKEISERKKEIEKKLSYIVEEDYLPLLIIFENYWQEKIIKKAIEENKPNPGTDPFEKGNLDIEKSFSEMWKWRRKKDFTNIDEKKQMSDSLIMPNYIIASSGMIKKVIEATTINLTDTCKRPLPCILIVGGPGSGKENMAKIVSRYSEDFRESEICTINMASLQPKLLAGLILSGTSLIDFEGLICRIIKKDDKPVVIIFDELNSLDVDSQGALLRLIENREMIEKGLQKEIPPNKKVLIIGLMNEDPERLTKCAMIYNIGREEKIFGGLIGEIMYEYVRKLRRLRDDLYDRMKRNAVIYIPELENRVEDLPFLFYIFLKEEIAEKVGRAKMTTTKIVIEYEAFEILMEKSIRWTGNVRQLQTIAKTVAKLSEADTDSIIINRHIIRQTLSKSGLLTKTTN